MFGTVFVKFDIVDILEMTLFLTEEFVCMHIYNSCNVKFLMF